MKNHRHSLYTNQYGTATKHSQAAYDVVVDKLLLVTLVSASLGLCSVAVDGRRRHVTWNFETTTQTLFTHSWRQAMWPLVFMNSLSLNLDKSSVSFYERNLQGAAMSILMFSLQLVMWDSHRIHSTYQSGHAFLQLFCSLLLSMVQLLIPQSPQLFTADGSVIDSEDSASVLGRYFMLWCNPAIVIAAKSGTLEALPEINGKTRSVIQPSIDQSCPYRPVWNRILNERFCGFVQQWTLVLVRSVLALVSPYCVMHLLEAVENSQKSPMEAWTWLIGLGAANIASTVVNHRLIWVQWSDTAIPVRAQLISSVFQKLLRRKTSKGQDNNLSKTPLIPDTISLVSSDTNMLSKFTAVNNLIGSTVLKFLTTSFFLLNILSWQSTLVAVLMTIFCLLMHSLTVRRLTATQQSLHVSRERTTKALEEAFFALRDIKFSSLEAPWESHINTLRDEELEHLFQNRKAAAIRRVCGTAVSFLVAASTMATHVYFGGDVTPSIIFPIVTLLPQLQEALRLTPLVLVDYLSSIETARRLDTYLASPEKGNSLQSASPGEVLFRDVTVTWPSDTIRETKDDVDTDCLPSQFCLKSLNLEFPVGKISLITGKTGSGKSLLLNAVLGEVDILSGDIVAPSVADGNTVAYVSQTPWLQNTTIQENILFGSMLDQQRYSDVITACALDLDFSTLPQADLTSVGLQGVKLSGGQRTRIALARALYSSAELLLIDDVLSSLDARVSSHIIRVLTGSLCHGRTLILAAHHMSPYLSVASYGVVLDHSVVTFAGDITQMRNEIGQSDSVDQPDLTKIVNVQPKPNKSKSLTRRTCVDSVQKLSNARSTFSLYQQLFHAAGGKIFTILFIIGLCITEILNFCTSYSFGSIRHFEQPESTSQPALSPSHHHRHTKDALYRNMQTYVCVSVVLIAAEYVSTRYAHSGSLRASRRLFREMVSKALRMPVQWLDSTPYGEVLKVFSVDARDVDNWALEIISDFAHAICKLVIIIIAGMYNSRYNGILAIFVILWCNKISRSYLEARAVVKKFEGGPIADIIEHISSTRSGLTTIRAFGTTNAFAKMMHHHIDRESKLRRYFYMFNRWFGLRMALIGIAFNMGTGAFMLASPSTLDSTKVGFALTFSMGLSRSLFDAVNEFSLLGSYMNSLSAILGYASLETESIDGDNVPPDWPSKGKIEVRELDVSYTKSLSYVLRSISFHIDGGQRIGLVGRTGAGKSTLALSLLRFLEPHNGVVLIDGIDISRVRLADLRSRVSIIPQDPVLYSGTVRSNLDFFGKEPMDKLENALRRVKLLCESSNNDSGLLTLSSHISVGGSNISQGQRQLICLARVLIKQPKILILDEATSAVDDTTNNLIQSIIHDSFSGTLIVVAHRLRTIASFDRVLVIDQGSIVDQGSIAELIEIKGAFFALARCSEDWNVLEQTILNA